MTKKGKEIIEKLEVLKNNQWVNEYKCYYGYYPIDYLNDILKKVYNEEDFENHSVYMNFIFRVRDNMEDKGIVKFSKAGTTFKILV